MTHGSNVAWLEALASAGKRSVSHGSAAGTSRCRRHRARPPEPSGLRIAFLIYRGNPRCGGQGVYTATQRELTRSAIPWRSSRASRGPRWTRAWLHADPGSTSTAIRPFRVPHPRSSLEGGRPRVAIMCTAGFGERSPTPTRPRPPGERRGDFDIIHDNQCLGTGSSAWSRTVALLTTLHHPITSTASWPRPHHQPWQRVTTKRWFGFLGMQVRVARELADRDGLRVLAPGHLVEMQVKPERMTVVPVGVDPTVFRRLRAGARAGAHHGHVVDDVPMKGSSRCSKRWRSCAPSVRSNSCHRAPPPWPGRQGDRTAGPRRSGPLRERDQ